MKLVIYTLFALLLLSSCEQCYTCKREIARTSDKPFPGYPVTAVQEFNVTKSDAEVFNSNSFVIEKDTINGVILTTNIKTKCFR
jgi:hypothetical protein